jgi:hypothetical protein
LELAVAPALEADLAFGVVVVEAAAMLTCDAFMWGPWWLGGGVDICTF